MPSRSALLLRCGCHRAGNSCILPWESDNGIFRVIPMVSMAFVSLYYTTNRFNHPFPRL